MFTRLTVHADHAIIELENIPFDVLGLSEAAAEMTSRGLGDSELRWYKHDEAEGTFEARYDLTDEEPYPGYDNPALRDNYDGIGTRDWFQNG